MKKVILVIASKDYQPVEYGVPKGILLGAGLEVITASDEAGMARAAHDGTETTVDVLVEDIDMADYDGLFFIGGPGALPHLDNEISYSLLQNWEMNNKPFGAICISPRILAEAGVLRGKKATGWDGDGKLAGIFVDNGVEYVKQDVVVDGLVITASGPAAAKEFGEGIVRLLS